MADSSRPAEGALPRMLAGVLTQGDLPDPLPESPIALLLAWFDDARLRGGYADFNAMTLATSTPQGEPSARIVLCKAVEPAPPALVFYTNYLSRKGRELELNPRAAAVFHWPHAGRQVRVEGRVGRLTADESDTYFRQRPLLSRLGAIASPQSRPIEGPAALVSALATAARDAALSGGTQRPNHWGGFRLLPLTVELWSAREGRLHERARWTRDDPAADRWNRAWLAP